MAQLQLILFGKPQVFLDDAPVTEFSTAKTAALFYYLAVTQRPHTRESLADLLWSDMPEAKAKRNLTKALSILRKRFEPFLVVARQEVSFNPYANFELDVQAFQKAVGPETGDEDVKQQRTTQRQAIDLYQGDFLEGFYVRGALEFEDWMVARREHYRTLMLDTLDQVIDDLITEQNPVAGIAQATRLLELDPWRESAHRQMMILLTQNGQRAAAITQYETCLRVLDDELGIDPMPETTELYERLTAQSAPTPSNLPVQPNTFIGRQTELTQLIHHLQDPACRMLTLVGPGGMGKTRLATQGASHFTRADIHLQGLGFSDGVYFIGLASTVFDDVADYAAHEVDDIDDLLVTLIAETLNVSFRGPSNLLRQLLDYLKDKTMLLVLDNLEHMVEGADVLARILRFAPHIKLLVTSRVRLNLAEEWVLELRGLTYPLSNGTSHTTAEVLAPADLAQYSAVALFTQKAQQARIGYMLVETETPDVLRICRLVDGVPLAIELAASWMRALSTTEIVTEIERNLDFLSTDTRNLPERHQSLRAIFEQSWQMLSAQEQVIFCKLSIFRGGFRRDAAVAIAGVTLATLTGLVDKSLLHHTSDNRYEVHELLRQYAAEKLWITKVDPQTSDELARDVWQRYSNYYLDFIAQQAANFWGDTPPAAIADVRSELDNIRQAWRWAVTECQIDKVDASVIGLSSFYDIAGLFQEGEAMFGLAIEQLQAHLETAKMPDDITVMQITLAKLLAEKARLLTRRGLAETALLLMPASADLALASEDVATQARVYRQWGEVLQYRNEYVQAQLHLERALSLAQPIKLADVEAEALRDLGIVALHQGDYAKATNFYEQVLPKFKALGHRRGAGIVYMNLGIIATYQGNYAEAEKAYAQALAEARDIGDRWAEGLMLNNLGYITYEQGKYTEAENHCQQALAITRSVNDFTTEAYTLSTLGNIMREQGLYTEARRYYEQCLHHCRAVNDRAAESEILSELGLLQLQLKDIPTARDQSERALAMAKSIGAPMYQALALTNIGHIQRAEGHAATALETYQTALDLRRSLNQPNHSLALLAYLADTHLALGELDEALSYIDEVMVDLNLEALYGTVEPFMVFLKCYRVLQATHDDRAAAVLEWAYDRLQERAANIEDPTRRQSFLENIATHRELVRAYED